VNPAGGERAATIVKNCCPSPRRRASAPGSHSGLSTRPSPCAQQADGAQVRPPWKSSPAPDVEVNANQIKQVFVNVINNACQRSPATRRQAAYWIARGACTTALR